MSEEAMKPEQKFALFLMVIVGIVAIIVVAIVMDKRRAASVEA